MEERRGEEGRWRIEGRGVKMEKEGGRGRKEGGEEGRRRWRKRYNRASAHSQLGVPTFEQPTLPW